MDPWVPARPGAAIADVDTPALILDLDVFDENLAKMAEFAARANVRLRPHAKSHKSVGIARKQLAAGAIGLCAQKLGEAEPFIRAGIEDVFISNEVVGDAKLLRLARLAAEYPKARIGICVDDATNVAALAAACRAEKARLDLYIELDVGQRRCGVLGPEAAVALGRAIAAEAESGLSLRGLHAYHGGAQHRRTVAERRAVIADVVDQARATHDALLAAGLTCDVVTGAGTGTFAYESASGVYGEIQPGSYPFMDVDYSKNEPDSDVPAFSCSLTLLTTVMSVSVDRFTVDCGTKAQSTDAGPAQLIAGSLPGWRVRGVNDEHAVFDRDSSAHSPTADRLRGPSLGEKLRLCPGHVDPTVNLHSWFVATRADRVVELIPIEARGGFY